MIRPVTCLCALLAAGSGLYLYQAKHQAQLEVREIQRLMSEADTIHQRAVVVATQYQLESNPERLGDLASRFLPRLKPTEPPQFTTLDDLDRRLPPVAPPAPPATPPVAEAVFDQPPAPAPSELPAAAVASAKPTAPAMMSSGRPLAAEHSAPSVASIMPALVASAAAAVPAATNAAPPSPAPVAPTAAPSPPLSAAPTVAPSPPKPIARYVPPTVREAPARATPPETRVASVARTAPYAPPPGAPMPASAPYQAAAPNYGYAGPAPSALGMARAMSYAPANQGRPYTYAPPIGNGN